MSGSFALCSRLPFSFHQCHIVSLCRFVDRGMVCEKLAEGFPAAVPQLGVRLTARPFLRHDV